MTVEFVRVRTSSQHDHILSRRIGIEPLYKVSAARHRMLEIEPCAERRSSAFQHHHTRGAIALQAFEIEIERFDQRRIERAEVFPGD